MTRVLSLRVTRPLVLACLAALVAATFVASTPRTADADTYPGLADIAAAKAAVAGAQAGVTQLDAVIVSLEKARQAAEDEALVAADNYVEAKDTAERTQLTSTAAANSANEAAAQLESARAALAGAAQQAYRDGGTMTSVEAIVGADGFEDVVARTEDNDRAATQLDAVTQKVNAAQLYADSMNVFAKKSADAAAVAAGQAATALAAAEDAQRTAEAAVEDAEATLDAAMVRLASLQNTTVQLERERQQGLANERAQRDRVAFDAAVLAAQKKAAVDKPAVPVTNPVVSPGGSTGGNTGGATGGTTGGTTGGSTGGTTGGTTGGSTGGTTGGATGGTTGPSPATGNWKSTAEEGQAAVDYALTLMGTQYKLGGNGPAYDCSGVTSAAWKSVGYGLSRSSQGQYNKTPLVPISDRRPGDLVFYGTDRDSTRITHVAIYIGNGLVAEATSYGKVAQVRAYDASWRVGNLIPYVGRP